MCGITGIVSRHPQDRAAIHAMTEHLAHRGPDGEGYWEDEAIALGHRRLSIIDLHGGAQPITNENGSIVLVCNGEIYNSPALRCSLLKKGHTFKTGTDVEVIIHLYEEYGRNCVTKLHGMFAFALWDAQREELMLARDHLGQKPLFYCQQGERLWFASEIKAVLKSGCTRPDLDPQALWHYMSLRFMPDDLTLFKGIAKLPAATSLTFKHGRVDVRRFWDVHFHDKLHLSATDLRDRLDEMIRATVRAHLLSDVRVGAFLSGGIDSTTVAAMMAMESEAPIPSFSIGVRERGFNELPLARLVAQRYGFERHEEIAKPDLINLLPEMVYFMDEPADPYGVGLYLASRLASRSVKVVLSGDGADESFGGYDRYAGHRLVSYYRAIPSIIRNSVIARLLSLIPETFEYKSLAQRLAWVQEMANYSAGERYGQSMGFLRFTDEAKYGLFTPEVIAGIAERDSMSKILVHYNSGNAHDPLDKMLYTDLRTRIPDHNLVMGDRMSMAHSLEVRSPFVDHELVEFAARLPPDAKVRRGRLKYALREVARAYLPDELVDRPKQGFGFPLGIWLRNELRGVLMGLLSNSRLVERGVLEAGAIDRLVREHLAGRVDHNYRLWILINMEIWHRLHIDGTSVGTLRTDLGRLA